MFDKMYAEKKKPNAASSRKQVSKRGRRRTKSVTITKADRAYLKTCTVGENPFEFTSSCAPDAECCPFVCLSCSMVRFATYALLRQHEDWCARVKLGGVLCLPCGRHYRNLGTLRRHSAECHSEIRASEGNMFVRNPFNFTTTVAADAGDHPHVCASCMVVCFSTTSDLRKHEDWCGQCVCAKKGVPCEKCCRFFRTDVLLQRHAAAGGCTNTDEASGTDNNRSDDGGALSENSAIDHDVDQKPVLQTSIYSVCPLCDAPFLTHHEQQIHFANVHNLTSEQKIKQSLHRLSRLGIYRRKVTCLDCSRVFSCRLDLVQHKRVCEKALDAAVNCQPVMPPPLAAETKSEIDRISPQEGDSDRAGKQAKCWDVSDHNECSNLGEGNSGPSGSDFDGVRIGISNGMLLNTSTLQSMVRCSDVKQLVLKPDGKVVLLDDHGQKISAINGMSQVTKEHRNHRDRETCSTAKAQESWSVANPGLSAEFLPVLPTLAKVDKRKCGARKRRRSGRSLRVRHKKDKHSRSKSLKSPSSEATNGMEEWSMDVKPAISHVSQSHELVGTELNQSTDGIQPCSYAHHSTSLGGVHYQILPSQVMTLRPYVPRGMKTEGEVTTHCNIGTPHKRTRKRPWHNTVIELDAENHEDVKPEFLGANGDEPGKKQLLPLRSTKSWLKSLPSDPPRVQGLDSNSEPRNHAHVGTSPRVKNSLVSSEESVLAKNCRLLPRKKVSSDIKCEPDLHVADLPQPARIGDSNQRNNNGAVVHSEIRNDVVQGEEVEPQKKLSVASTTMRPSDTNHNAVLTLAKNGITGSGLALSRQQRPLELPRISGQGSLADPESHTRLRTRPTVTIVGTVGSLQYVDTSVNTGLSKSSGQQTVELSPLTLSNSSDVVEDSVCKRAGKIPSREVSMPHIRHTVETFGSNVVRCVRCKTIFQTVRQIVGHICD